MPAATRRDEPRRASIQPKHLSSPGAQGLVQGTVQGHIPNVKHYRDRQTDPHLHLLQHGVVFYPREENAHGVGAVIQKGDASPIQVVGQLVDVCLQLSKGWGGKSTIKQHILESQHTALALSPSPHPQHPTDGPPQGVNILSIPHPGRL